MIAQLQSIPFFTNKQIDHIELLSEQGYCNENYLVVAEGVKYIVRKLLRKDRDREWEWIVQQLVYKEGITAKPIFFDREEGMMVSSYLEGIHLQKMNEKHLRQVAKTLQKLHTLSIQSSPIELMTDIQPIADYPKEYVLCHNDLNPKNIIFAKDVYLIDWEYAGINDRYFDLASVCIEFGLDEEMHRVFLEAYFDGEDFNLEKLEAYKAIYTQLCDEWFENNT